MEQQERMDAHEQRAWDFVSRSMQEGCPLERLCDAATQFHSPRDSFYTPSWFAKPLVQAALNPLMIRGYIPCILDLGAGCGGLLWQAALRVLDVNRHASVTHLLSSRFFGVDVDPVAVAFCRALLCTLCDSEEDRLCVLHALRRHIVVGDALTYTWNQSFDLIVSNPPWCNISLNTPQTQPCHHPLLQNTARRQLNVYHFFIIRAMDMASPHGRFLFILPDSALVSHVCRNIFVAPTHTRLQLDAVWHTPLRTIWPTLAGVGFVLQKKTKTLLQQGCIGIFGNVGSAAYNYVVGHWPDTSHWTTVSSHEAFRMEHLVPDPLWCRLRNRCRTTYGTLNRFTCHLGNTAILAATGFAVAPAREASQARTTAADGVVLQKGSVFHLRFLCDNLPCFPRRNDAIQVAADDVVHVTACTWLLSATRPEVVAMPLFLDREHRHKEQLRSCLLPMHCIVDNTVCLHHATGRRFQRVWTRFLLGFWNSRPVEHLVTMSLPPSTKFIRLSTIQNVPVPSQLDDIRISKNTTQSMGTILDRLPCPSVPSSLGAMSVEQLVVLIAHKGCLLKGLSLAWTIAGRMESVRQRLANANQGVAWGQLSCRHPGIIHENRAAVTKGQMDVLGAADRTRARWMNGLLCGMSSSTGCGRGATIEHRGCCLGVPVHPGQGSGIVSLL